MIYLIQCLDKIKVGWTDQPFEHYLKWLQRRLPWYVKVLATRQGTIEEEKNFHRENAAYRADWGGNEWYSLDMLPAAREFLTVREKLPEVPTEVASQ
jgi:hypothetical protein